MEITLKFSSQKEMNDFLKRFKEAEPARPEIRLNPVQEEPKPQAAAAPEPAPQAGPEPAPQVGTRTYTLDELAGVMSTLIDAGKLNQVRDTILEFGVPAINELDPAHYPAFAAKLEAIGGKFNG